jgi:hypothetical protein
MEVDLLWSTDLLWHARNGAPIFDQCKQQLLTDRSVYMCQLRVRHVTELKGATISVPLHILMRFCY